MADLPWLVTSELFPFEGDVTVKAVPDRVIPEPPRAGAGGVDCRSCAASDDGYIWTNDRWRVGIIKGFSCALILSLSTRDHYDSPDMPDEHAAELGPLLIKMERAILATGGIGRVHFAKWMDGAEHLHWWVIAREEGALEQRGFGSVLWGLAVPHPNPGDAKRRAMEVAEALGR